MSEYIAGEQIRKGDIIYIHEPDGKAYRPRIPKAQWNLTAPHDVDEGGKFTISYPTTDLPASKSAVGSSRQAGV